MFGENLFLLLGSNLGNKRAFLQKATTLLQQGGFVLKKSSAIYCSEPWGNPDQDWFENQCLMGSFGDSPEKLLSLCLDVEKMLGRERKGIWTARTIDIDILLWGSLLHDFNNLQIPHPRLIERRFALMPLCELAPDAVHPQTGKTIKMHLQLCEDLLKVHVIDN